MKSLKQINLENARKHARKVAVASEHNALDAAIAQLDETLEDLNDRAERFSSDEVIRAAYEESFARLVAARDGLVYARNH